HVQDLDALPRVPVLDAVAEHDGAERAGGRDRLRPRGEDLVGAVVVHAGADLLLHPHAAAARAAAETLLAVAGQLHPAVAAGGQRVEHRARGVVLAVPATEVTGIVEGDLGPAPGTEGRARILELDLAGGDQLAHQLGVV